MNNLFYNPPLFPLRMRGFCGIHFFKSFLQGIKNSTKKNQKINSSIPLHWRGSGVGQ